MAKVHWDITREQVEAVRTLIEQYRDHSVVQSRVERNVEANHPKVTKDRFWHAMVFCLLTSQQKSGPNSAINRFRCLDPFPLRYEICRCEPDLETYAWRKLKAFGGIRFTDQISRYVARNLWRLEHGLWGDTLLGLDRLALFRTQRAERRMAEFVRMRFKGFGPKQSRNLLQQLGLTRYETPIDSRVAEWLNENDLPIDKDLLSRIGYYNSASDSFQKLAKMCGIYPCILDAAIFVSFDQDDGDERDDCHSL